MAGASLGSVFVSLGLDAGSFSTGLDAASAKLKSFGSSASASLEKSTASMKTSLTSLRLQLAEVAGERVAGGIESLSDQMLELGKAALLPVAALASVTGAVEALKAQIERADAAGKAAASLGLSVESLTQFQHAAELADVSNDQLAVGLRQLAKNALADAQGATGSATLAFKTLGISVVDANGKLKPTNELFTAVAGKFAGMENGAEKTGLAMQLFGRSGASLIPILNEGSAGLEEMAKQSDALGLTISAKAAAGAAELADQVKLLGDRLQGIVSTVTQASIPAIEGMVDAFSDFIDNADGGGQVINVLEGGVRDLTSLMVQLTGAAQQAVDVFEGLQSAFEALQRGEGANSFFATLKAYAQQAAIDGAKANDTAAAILAGTYKPPGGGAKPITGSGSGSDPTLATAGGTSSAKKIAETTASLQRQIAALTETNKQQAESNALKEAGITADDSAAPKIIELADALYDQKTAQAAVNDATKLFADTAESDFEGVLSGTETLNQALGDLLQTLGEAVLKAALLGEGPLAGLLGTAPAQSGGIGGLFGDIAGALGLPGHADGTANTGGTRGVPAGIVHGQEAVIPLPSGGKVPVSLSMPKGGFGGSGTNITYAPTIHAPGADSATVAKLAAVVAADRANFESKVIKTFRTAKKQRKM